MFSEINIRDEKTARLADAHKRANERANQNRRRRRPVQGTVRLSNTDSLGRAARVRARLAAKIGEIMASDIEDDMKAALSRNVQMQMDRVENTVRQIKRRKRAEEEEKRERTRNEKQRAEELQNERLRQQREETRRRRRRDMQQQSINIRRDFLSSAERGGLNPRDFSVRAQFENAPSPAISFDIGGKTSTIADITTLDTPVIDIML
ncbi:MAG: hypothetical protein FWG65_02130 [Turicibacter sp.]|nr:hypothetical protein [Turicibacter sp.]